MGGGDRDELAVPGRDGQRRGPVPSGSLSAGANRAAATTVVTSSLVWARSTISAMAAASPTTSWWITLSGSAGMGAASAGPLTQALTRGVRAYPAAVIAVSVLDAVELHRDGERIPVRAGKTAEVLVRLALEAGVMVRTERLIEDLWADEAVGTARNTLQTKVSRLRRALGDAALVTGTSAGYTLQVDPSAVDALEVLRLAEQASALRSAGDPSAALETCTSALAMFRGEILSGAGDGDWVVPHRARLEEVRLGLIEGQLAARLDLGAAGDVIGELEALVSVHPLREGLWALLMVALYRDGRQADALATYQRVRTRLADELGLDPGLQLQQLEQQILVHDASLGVPYSTVRGLGPDAPAGNLPSMSVELVGRDDRSGCGVRSARQPAARRDRRAGRRRQDGRGDRGRPRAELVGRCRARRRLVGPTRNRGDRRRCGRHAGRGVERGRRGGAVRAAQERRRVGHPRQLRARHRRRRGARRSPPRRRPRAADLVHQPGSARRRR